ncbi:TOMM precursor leader peptide-binding protein [Streptomonospora halophila]|uniref:TOMM leader peptide-binding protein n=1 Tax=Streptomonospora halophila TaxID=427369 RepID=A0ABP9GWZ0_9ACTN
MTAEPTTAPPTVRLLGEGLLYDTLCARLGGPAGGDGPGGPLDVPAEPGEVVVLGREGWEPERDLAEQTAVRSRGALLLPVRVIGDLGVVGPWVRPGTRGCQVCAERRRRLWRKQDFTREPLEGALPALPLTASHLDHLASLASHALSTGLLGEHELYAARGDLAGQVHRANPLPGCPGCCDLPDDSAEAARLELRSRPQSDPEAFRTRPDGLPGSALRARLHDWRYGPVGHVFRADNSAGALVSAELALTGGESGEGGYGRAATYPAAESVALYEAAERLASATPHGKRTVVHGSQNALPDAVDLRELGLHDPAYYDHPLFRFQPYDPDAATEWVWGWRTGAQHPVLVPEHVAYWHVDRWRRTSRGARFLYESSNGAAIGSNIEEAVLYGLLEVVERDSFLLCWYTRRPARRLEADDEVPQLRGMRATLRSLGYRLHLFDIASEIGVPAVLSVVVRDDDAGPVAFFAAGAHCDPRRAAAAAASEAVTNAVVRVRTPAEERAEFEDDARALLEDPTRTQTLREHTVLYNLPETRPWWSFLDTGAPGVTLAEAYGDWRTRWQRDDLTDVLREVLRACGAAGLDPIVVDQTDRCTPRAPATVKVVVPQTLPMTFGHVHRRTEGLRRLTDAPVALGYRTPEDPAPDLAALPPHPFP